MPTLNPFASKPAALAAALLTTLCGAAALGAESDPPAVAQHVAAATAAAGTQWQGLLHVLCETPSPAAPAAARTPAPAAPTASAAPAAKPPERATWYAAPVKVFDNLYFVGMTDYSAWAVTTSAGIILVDTLYDYSVEAEVVDGLRQLGLAPETIRYAIVSHGHRDHAGGAKYLQDRFGTKIVLAAADWELLERSGDAHPRRDVVAHDGMKLTLGDTTLRLYVTPGHTLGTLSTVIPLQDHGQPHVAVSWGGTGFNWLKNRPEYITRERSDAFWFRRYGESAERFAEIAARAHADVLLSNHTYFDGSKAKLPLLSTRRAEQPNPYVVGATSVRDYLRVAAECAQAGLARLPAH